jgi:hypothetical protein
LPQSLDGYVLREYEMLSKPAVQPLPPLTGTAYAANESVVGVPSFVPSFVSVERLVEDVEVGKPGEYLPLADWTSGLRETAWSNISSDARRNLQNAFNTHMRVRTAAALMVQI